VRWPFDLFQQFTDVVVVNTRARSEGPRSDHEGGPRDLLSGGTQAQAQEVVNRLLEGPTRFSHFGSQLCPNVLVEGQGGSHIKMLG
jgi:hypothetical protein